MSGTHLTGSCLCGGVRFEITEAPRNASYCHCTRCQRRTGSGSSAQAHVDGRAFRVVAGQELVKGWRHPDGGFEKFFCVECGAHLFACNPDEPSQMGVRMPAFDQDPGVRPTMRTHVSSAAYWELVPDDGLRRFDGSPF